MITRQDDLNLTDANFFATGDVQGSVDTCELKI